MTPLDGIIEMEEVGNRRANYLLALGFRLLGLGEKHYETRRMHLAPGMEDGATYIRRDLRYVIGRTAEQAAFPAWGSERDDHPESA